MFKFLKDDKGHSSSNRLVFLLSYLVILGLMVYTIIDGDQVKSEMLEKYAFIILPTSMIGKVAQRFTEK